MNRHNISHPNVYFILVFCGSDDTIQTHMMVILSRLSLRPSWKHTHSSCLSFCLLLVCITWPVCLSCTRFMFALLDLLQLVMCYVFLMCLFLAQVWVSRSSHLWSIRCRAGQAGRRRRRGLCLRPTTWNTATFTVYCLSISQLCRFKQGTTIACVQLIRGDD